MKSIIRDEIKKAKYYSIIVDSTPDIAYVDQLSFVVRYVNENGEPAERFLMFCPNPGHKAEKLFETVMGTLENLTVDISDCRGQSYNASNMSGAYSGLQAHIKEINPKAYYIPCAAHSLNLVGKNAAGSCQQACFFFNLIQNIYHFFSASTSRWEKLKTFMTSNTKSVKNLSQTRWSAREAATESIHENWEFIKSALEHMHLKMINLKIL